MNCISMSNINCAALKCLSKINVFFENVLPAAMRGASREAGASLEQQIYYFLRKINLFFQNVLPAAMRSASKNKNKNKNKISFYKV